MFTFNIIATNWREMQKNVSVFFSRLVTKKNMAKSKNFFSCGFCWTKDDVVGSRWNTYALYLSLFFFSLFQWPVFYVRISQGNLLCNGINVCFTHSQLYNVYIPEAFWIKYNMLLTLNEPLFGVHLWCFYVAEPNVSLCVYTMYVFVCAILFFVKPKFRMRNWVGKRDSGLIWIFLISVDIWRCEREKVACVLSLVFMRAVAFKRAWKFKHIQSSFCIYSSTLKHLANVILNDENADIFMCLFFSLSFN